MSTQQPVKIFIPTSSMGYFHEHLGWWAVVIDPQLKVGQDISFIESNKTEPFMEAKVVEIAQFVDPKILSAYLNTTHEDWAERFVGWYIIKYAQAIKKEKSWECRFEEFKKRCVQISIKGGDTLTNAEEKFYRELMTLVDRQPPANANSPERQLELIQQIRQELGQKIKVFLHDTGWEFDADEKKLWKKRWEEDGEINCIICSTPEECIGVEIALQQ